MRILYAETTAHLPSSAHFLDALTAMAARGECEFRFHDEERFIPSHRTLLERVARRVIGRPLSGYRAYNLAMIGLARDFRPDIVLVGKGAYLEPATVAAVRKVSNAFLVNWATDDPFNPANSPRTLVQSIPLYDLYVSTKRAVMADIERAGCRNVMYLPFGYKPEVHFPETPANADERSRFECDAAFIGGADADRVPYFRALVRAIPEIRLNLFGGFWNRYPDLRPYWRGSAIGRDFRLATGGAKISINLVRRANRDDNVMRTFEIPACGGFMMTERTPTHEKLFAEDREAVFFTTPDEMAAKVREWLARDDDRCTVAAAGLAIMRASQYTYADRLSEILAASSRLIIRPTAASMPSDFPVPGIQPGPLS